MDKAIRRNALGGNKRKGSATIPYASLTIIGAFLFSRLLLISISCLMKVEPFLCYDDKFIYDRISGLSNSEMLHWLIFRNTFYPISNYLNVIRIGEYITGTRILNTILWLHSCFIIRSIARRLHFDKKTVKRVVLFTVLAPVFLFYSMAELREVICAWGILYLSNEFLRYENKEKLSIARIMVVAVIVFFTRTAVLEIFAAILLLYIFRNGKACIKASIFVFALFAFFFFLRSENYLYVIRNKVDNYIFESTVSESGILSKIEVKKIQDIYKLIVLIPYVQIIPLPGEYEAYYTAESWSAWITFFAGIQSFLLPFFWIYVVKVKKSTQENALLCYYLVMLVVLALAKPDNYRFFVFTTPFYYLFSIRAYSTMKRDNRMCLGAIFGLIPYLYLLM